jgi:hypothetical protein
MYSNVHSWNHSWHHLILVQKALKIHEFFYEISKIAALTISFPLNRSLQMTEYLSQEWCTNRSKSASNNLNIFVRLSHRCDRRYGCDEMIWEAHYRTLPYIALYLSL